MQKVRVYSSKGIYIVAVAMSIACALSIFMMSHEVAAVSSERSGGISDTVTNWLFRNIDKLEKGEQTVRYMTVDHYIRKIAHFCIYALLGALFCSASFYRERTWRGHFIASFVWAVLYAASDEMHQMFVPGRGPSVSDVILDAFGVATGVLLLISAARRFYAKVASVDNKA